MRTENIDFETFENEWINLKPELMAGSYVPVYLTQHEKNDGEMTSSIRIVMICPWRLDDGKAFILKMNIQNQKQLQKIKTWMSVVTTETTKSLLQKSDQVLEKISPLLPK